MLPEAMPLKRVVGVGSLGLNVVNLTIAAGIFGLPAIIAAILGAQAILAYLVCAVLFGLVGLCLAEAGSRVGSAGRPVCLRQCAVRADCRWRGRNGALGHDRRGSRRGDNQPVGGHPQRRASGAQCSVGARRSSSSCCSPPWRSSIFAASPTA